MTTNVLKKKADITLSDSAQAIEHICDLLEIKDSDNIHHLLDRINGLVNAEKRMQHQQRDIEKLVMYMEQLQHDIIAVEQSRAWRIGYKIMAYMKSATGRKPGRYAFANIHRVLTIYHHWKKARD